MSGIYDCMFWTKGDPRNSLATVKIAILIPHTGTVRAETAACLAAMTGATAGGNITYNGKPARPIFGIFTEGLGSLERKRTSLANSALKWGSDYSLLIDSDQTFPTDGLVRLMERDKPVIAGNYARRHGDPCGAAIGLDEEPVEQGNGLESVLAVGLGFCLIKTPIFNSIPRPWFASEHGPAGEIVRTEDVHFCNQIRSVGIPVFIDHDVRIGHVATEVLMLSGGDAVAAADIPSAGPQ